MLHSFTGRDQLDDFWDAVKAHQGLTLSSGAASFLLRCSYEHLHQLIDLGELEAWSYQEGGVVKHFMVSRDCVVRFGIRMKRFQSSADISGLKISDEEFAALREEALRTSSE